MTRVLPPLAGALAGALALAGCAVGPDYRPPDIALAPAFHAEPPPAAAGAEAARLEAWWGAFGDPELSRIVERAAAQNLDLAVAKARLSQSRAAAKAAGAALLPSAAATGSAARIDQSLNGEIGSIGRRLPGFERDIDDYSLGVGAAWEIDLFGGLRRRREAAKADAAAAAADAEGVKVAVEADAADAYLQVRALQARIGVARRQAAVEQDRTALLNQRVRQGVSAERELHLAEADLEGVRASIPPLSQALEAELNRLDIVMGAAPGTYAGELAAGGAIPSPPALADSLAPGDLLRRRPDLIAAEGRLRAANARIGAAISAYYPKLSLAGLVGVDSLTSAAFFHDDSQEGQMVAGLRWRLFDFGRVDAEVAAARGEDAEALAVYRRAVLTATAEVEDAFTALAQERRRAIALERQITALATARRQAEDAFADGVSSLIDVRDADRDLLTASDRLVQAQAGEARAAVASFRALGGGWTVPLR
jgi:NodT family efflux transporter outer membrane factor (OMF) lipoprotein